VILFAGIIISPMLINGIRYLDQPSAVLDLFHQFSRGKKLDAIRSRIA
jgi:hypothetical protein